jgi:tRNA (guanine-N7-)-methyltransferase
MHEPSPAPAQRRVRSFVRRGGRMGTGQRRALLELGPLFVLPFEPRLLDLTAAFGRAAPTIVEVGFGMGVATAAIAAAQPQANYLGVEVHEAGVGMLLRLIAEQRLTNIRIIQHDAVEVLQTMVAPASLAGAHIYFPDPWPKKRHQKRRLVQAPFVALLASRLQPGAYLHCATDWEPYAQQMLQVLSAEPTLINTGGGFAPRLTWRPLTKFEQRGLNLGHSVHDLLFKRRSIDAGSPALG